MAEDWDLHAVVRGCSTVASSSVSSSSSPSSSGFASCYFHPEAAVSSSSSSSSSSGFNIFKGEQGISQVLSLSAYPFEARSSIEELHELCKPFFSKSQPLTLQASSPLSSLSSYSSAPPKSVSTQEKQQQRSKQAHAVTTPRSKRRKNQLKKVCQVPVENLSSDIWAWRKYGQKPIKGSPYPRGYYRCSSSKGCLARKQVERNRSDPTMFIVTYTAEHNHPAPTHRNSLAGSTRQKPLVPQTATTTEEDSDKSKSLTKPTSPTTSGAEEEAPTPPQGEKSESREEKEDVMDDEEEDEFGLSDMVLSDDFFESLDELSQLTAPSVVTGDCFSDPFSAIAIPSWVASGAATAGGCR